MSTTPTKAPAPSSSSGDDRNLVSVDETYIAPSFEDRLALFWAKHSRTVLVVFLAVVLAVVAQGGYDYYAAWREKAVTADYAAATTDAKLKAFIADHASHLLAGIAQLTLADEAYAAGKFADAQADYVKAAAILGKTPFGQRARLGAAISLLQAGKTAEGETALKEFFADLSVAKSLRAEAAYQLASLAAEAGQTDEATKLIAQINAIDAAGQWAQRAILLRARLPAQTVADAIASELAGQKAAAPAVNFKATP